MPPLLEDVTSSASEAGDAIPFKAKARTVEVEESSSEDEEEFIVEKILEHGFDNKGDLIFKVKWQGYEDEADTTWEPEGNLETAPEVLTEYYATIGGRPPPEGGGSKKKAAKRGPKKRNFSHTAEDDEDAESSAPPPKARGRRGRPKRQENDDSGASTPRVIDAPSSNLEGFPPKSNNWDKYVIRIQTIDEIIDPTDGQSKRMVYMDWHDGQNIKVTLQQAHARAPGKMLQFYERHLVWTNPASSNTNGAGNSNLSKSAAHSETDDDAEETKSGP